MMCPDVLVIRLISRFLTSLFKFFELKMWFRSFYAHFPTKNTPFTKKAKEKEEKKNRNPFRQHEWDSCLNHPVPSFSRTFCNYWLAIECTSVCVCVCHATSTSFYDLWNNCDAFLVHFSRISESFFLRATAQITVSTTKLCQSGCDIFFYRIFFYCVQWCGVCARSVKQNI